MLRFSFAIAALISCGPAFCAEKSLVDKAGAQIISFDTTTNGDEIMKVVRRLVGEDVASKSTRVIFIVSGTHGLASGEITPSCKEVTFKAEDLKTAGITRANINVRDYTLTAPNKWSDLNEKGKNNVIVLGWCYSYQWLGNTTANGNNGKISIK